MIVKRQNCWKTDQEKMQISCLFRQLTILLRIIASLPCVFFFRLFVFALKAVGAVASKDVTSGSLGDFYRSLEDRSDYWGVNWRWFKHNRKRNVSKCKTEANWL